MDAEIDETDNYEDLYNSDDDSKHTALVSKLLSLHKNQQLKKSSRSEPALQITEFNLVGRSHGVNIEDLTNPLKTRKGRAKISDKVSKLSRISKTLPKPLEKPQADRIQRAVGYEQARLALDRWEGVVTSNRVQPQLQFPLESDLKLEKKNIELGPTAWALKTSLERELEAVDNEDKTEIYNVETQADTEFPLTVEEIMERRKEAAKMRAYQSILEAKARRQNKIKSKKYHRIQKRERIKKQLQEFELLQKTNPEEALQKLEEIERARAEERFSLRHKSTGQWARNKQIRAKYDKESRQVLAQQLTISRELTKKVNVDKDSEESDEEIEEKTAEFTENDKDNPWVTGMKPEKEMIDFVSGYRKFWNEKKEEAGKNEEIEDLDINDEEEQDEEVETRQNNVNNKLTDEKEEKISKVKKMKKSIEKEKVHNGMSFMELTRMRLLAQKEKRNKKRTLKNGDVEEENVGKKESVKKTKKIKIKKDGVSNNEITPIIETKNKTKKKKKDDPTANWSEAGVEEMFNNLEKKLVKKKLHQAKRLEKRMSKEQNPTKVPKKQSKTKADLSMPAPVNKPIIDEEMTETATSANENVPSSTTDLQALTTILNMDTSNGANIDTEKYLKITKTTKLESAIPDLVTQDDDLEDDLASTNQKAMCEAFEDDDIADDFQKEKEKQIADERPKDIDLSLPGWGSWGGEGIKPNKRKKKRFIIKAPEQMPRRDDNKGELIINEKAAKKIKEHQVTDLPFPFKAVRDFEASIRAPIGNTFVTEAAFRKLTRPAVVTKMGAVIKPMSKDYVLEKNS